MKLKYRRFCKAPLLVILVSMLITTSCSFKPTNNNKAIYQYPDKVLLNNSNPNQAIAYIYNIDGKTIICNYRGGIVILE